MTNERASQLAVLGIGIPAWTAAFLTGNPIPVLAWWILTILIMANGGIGGEED